MTGTKLIFAKALIELIKSHPLEKISVTQITKQAKLTRQTFYRNFVDKYDLVNWYFEKLCLQSFKEMGVECTLKEALVKKFTFIQSEKAFFKEAFKMKDYNSVVEYDYRTIYNFYKNIILNKNNTLDSNLDFLLQMYCHGSIQMTVNWVTRDNMKQDVNELADLLIEALPEGLRPYLIMFT